MCGVLLICLSVASFGALASPVSVLAEVFA
jgi:hypothetical protein